MQNIITHPTWSKCPWLIRMALTWSSWSAQENSSDLVAQYMSTISCPFQPCLLFQYFFPLFLLLLLVFNPISTWNPAGAFGFSIQGSIRSTKSPHWSLKAACPSQVHTKDPADILVVRRNRWWSRLKISALERG